MVSVIILRHHNTGSCTPRYYCRIARCTHRLVPSSYERDRRNIFFKGFNFYCGSGCTDEGLVANGTGYIRAGERQVPTLPSPHLYMAWTAFTGTSTKTPHLSLEIYQFHISMERPRSGETFYIL